MRPSSRRAIARNTAARPSPQTRCGWDNYPACRTHLPPATHRLTAKRSACFSRFHLSNYTSLPCACARRKPCKHGADGLFLQRIAPKYIRGPIISVNLKTPQTLVAVRTAGCRERRWRRKAPMPFSCLCFRPPQSRRSPRKICPKTARNPSPGQGPPRPEGGHTAAHRGEHGASATCAASFCCTC